MIKLLFKTGTISDKLAKIKKIDNMRMELEKKIEEGVEFSNELTIALLQFPISDIETHFFIVDGEIKVFLEVSDAANTEFRNAGYAKPMFVESDVEEEKEWICYCVSPTELKKIGWLDANEIKTFVTEVFTVLECMPDEII